MEQEQHEINPVLEEKVEEKMPAVAPKTITISIPAAIITGAAIIGLAIILVALPHKKDTDTKTAPTTQQQAPSVPTSVPANIVTVRPTDFVRGDIAKATVAIFEYSDSDCPYCQRFHPTLQQVLADYKGKVVWVYRYFPLDIHPNSHTESEALQCAGTIGGNDAFWKYLDTVVNVTLNNDPKSNEALVTFATQAGVDATKFKACMANPSAADAIIDADSKEAQAFGAQGTPFSIAVNLKTGKQVTIPGAYPLADVKKMIDSIL